MLDLGKGGNGMSTELWFGIIRYFISIVIILALLVSLMEASRKYDRYRDSAHLSLSIGYCLLIIWGLIQAIGLTSSVLTLAGTIIQIIGFISLVIGYRLLKPLPHDFSELDTPDSTHSMTPTESPISDGKPVQELNDSTRKEKDTIASRTAPDWVTLLAATEVEQLPQSNQSETAEQSLLTESVKPIDQPMAEGLNQSTLPVQSASITKMSPKKTKVDPSIPVDLSYLAQRKRKSTATETVTSAVSTQKPAPESRQDMLDDLFPLKHKKQKPEQQKPPKMAEQPQQKQPDDQQGQREMSEINHDDAILPGEHHEHMKSPVSVSKKPAKIAAANQGTPKVSDKKKISPSRPKIVPAAAGLVMNGFSGAHLLSVWPLLLLFCLLVYLVSLIWPQRQQKGQSILALGLIFLTLSLLVDLLFGSLVFIDLDFSSPGQWLSLVGFICQAIGYILIGIASWQKIRGKITHHFLTIVAGIYGVLILLTAGLAVVVAKDEASLRMLFILITGVLITLLPIIHAFTYNHPHHRPEES